MTNSLQSWPQEFSPNMIYGNNWETLQIHAFLAEYDTVWWKVRKVRHEFGSSCWHIFIDSNNQSLYYQWKPLEGIGETKEINGKAYTRASFQDRVMRYYDEAFQPLPIEQWMEDDHVIGVIEVNGVSYALRKNIWVTGDINSSIDNWSESATFLVKHKNSIKPKFLEPIERGWKTYLVVQYHQSWSEREDYDILVVDENLDRVGEYPIYNVALNTVENATKIRLDELISEAA